MRYCKEQQQFVLLRLTIITSLDRRICAENTLGCDLSLTMTGLEVRASSLLTKASSCCMSAGGGSTRTGSRQDRVESWTHRSGHDKASNSRDRSWTGDKNHHVNHFLEFLNVVAHLLWLQ